ncbi:MAG: MipA/OmpV family protein [Proteobacteria bacterium]|nr:MipA/OmpV family protein [Pseudomonadota bacterium]
MKIPFHLLKGLAVIVLLSLAAPNAFAQAFDAVRLTGGATDKDRGSAGLAVIAGMAYQGADERRTLVLPGLDYQWRNGWFAGTRNGIGYNFGQTRELQYGLRVTADFGRDESRSDALRGMGDIDPKPELGAFLNYSLNKEITLTSSLRYGSGNDSAGMVIDLGAGYSTKLSPLWRLGFGASMTLANEDYMQSYFGVTAAQSASSGYSAYRPGFGLRDVRANAALSYQITPSVAILGTLSVSSLQGDAKDSPLTRQATSVTGVATVSYEF